MSNISKRKREALLSKLEELKNSLDNDEMVAVINEVESELNRKKYGLVWEEHEERVDIEMQTKIPVFTEVKAREIKTLDENKYNFLLEGDNLHSLKLLEKTHKGKIDVIYIDPPYNRSKNDFIYNDSMIGDSDAFRHSKWLSFMYKRLKIAHGLLTINGVVLISIDENEVHNLKLLSDEIFEEQCYIGDFIRKTKSSTNDSNHFFNQQHEYCLIYKKQDFSFNGVEKDLTKYKNTDMDKNGAWNSSDPSAKSGGDSTYFPIKNPYTETIDYPPEGRFWAFSKKTMEKYIDEGKIKFKRKFKENERGFIFKTYLKDLKSQLKPVDSLAFIDNIFMNQAATKEIKKFNIKFDYPKPVEFIKSLLAYSTKNESIILDFFAGTGTTAQAVMELNKEDGGSRQYIICTNNENSICETVTYTRAMNTCQEYSANLKYYKTEFINKSSDGTVSTQLMNHIKELIQLEHHIDIDNEEIKVVFNELELDEVIAHKNIRSCKKLFIPSDIFTTAKQDKLIEELGIGIIEIPTYYFAEELREVNEL